MNRLEQIQEILRFLQTGTPNVEGCALVTMDGLLMSSALPEGADGPRLASLAISILRLSSKIAEDLERGALEQVQVRGTSGHLIATQATSETVLLLLAGPEVKMGLLSLDIRRAKDQIQLLLPEETP